MYPADNLEELLRRIKSAKHFDFRYRSRIGVDWWKDPGLCRNRLDLAPDEADNIIRHLRKENCYKVEMSLNPNHHGKKFFFRYGLKQGATIEVVLFIKLYSPHSSMIIVDSFHEADMPESVKNQMIDEMF